MGGNGGKWGNGEKWGGMGECCTLAADAQSTLAASATVGAICPILLSREALGRCSLCSGLRMSSKTCTMWFTVPRTVFRGLALTRELKGSSEVQPLRRGRRQEHPRECFICLYSFPCIRATHPARRSKTRRHQPQMPTLHQKLLKRENS